MEIGTVRTFPLENLPDERGQALKIIEEAAEVFGACDVYRINPSPGQRLAILLECSDVIQSTCNLLALLGIDDASYLMEICEESNKSRGRYDVQE